MSAARRKHPGGTEASVAGSLVVGAEFPLVPGGTLDDVVEHIRLSAERDARVSLQTAHRLVLAEGRGYSSIAPTPPPRATPGECFYNAQSLALDDARLTYVEGFATRTDAPHRLYEHAWCVDADGQVYDPTWSPAGTAYVGVAFKTATSGAAWASRVRAGAAASPAARSCTTTTRRCLPAARRTGASFARSATPRRPCRWRVAKDGRD